MKEGNCPPFFYNPQKKLEKCMSDKNPEFMLRDRNTGRIFGVNPVQELMPNMEKVRFEDVYPEKCMPEHVKKKDSG